MKIFSNIEYTPNMGAGSLLPAEGSGRAAPSRVWGGSPNITVLLLAIILIACMLSACGETTENGEQSRRESTVSEISENAEVPSATKEIFAMDTYMTVTAYGEKAQEAVDAAEKEISRLDDLLSVGSSDSEVYQINHNGSGALSDDTAALVEKSHWIYENTDGAYDITVYPLMDLWGFTGEVQAVPSDEEIQKVLSYSGFDKLTYEDGVLTLGENQGIDFGGIAKGYASARIMEIFAEYDIVSGVVSLGGNVQCYGTKPDGSLWRCGITDPDDPENTSSLLGVVSIRDKAVITSGGYERFFTDDKSGKTYHHIMDPATGYSAENGLRSVTIVSRDGTLADGLSTACFVMGRDKALTFWRENSDKFDMVLMSDDGTITVTGGLKENFSSSREFELAEK